MAKGRKSSTRVARGPRLQDTVRLSAEGLASSSGDLEARVMRVVGQIGQALDCARCHERVADEHDVSLLTVITVLNKLRR